MPNLVRMSFSGGVRDQNAENVPTQPSLTEGRMSRRKMERRGTVSRALCGHVCLVRIAFIAYYACFTEIESGSTSPHWPLHMRVQGQEGGSCLASRGP